MGNRWLERWKRREEEERERKREADEIGTGGVGEELHRVGSKVGGSVGTVLGGSC